MGANRRRKRAQRRGRRSQKKGFMRFMSTGVLYAGMFTAGTALFFTFRGRMPGLEGIADILNMNSRKVERVELQGAEHVSSEEIIRRSGIKLPVTLDELKREYLYILSKTSPWIEKVQLMAAGKGAVTLGVVERRPVAMIRTQTGTKVSLIDAEGVCLPLDRRTARKLPLVSGLADSVGECGVRRLTENDRDRMNRFLSCAAAADSSFLRHITQADFSGEGIVRVMLTGSPTVITLDEGGVTAGLQRLMLVWEAMGGDTARPGRIDLSCRNLAFVSGRAVVSVRTEQKRSAAADRAGTKNMKKRKNRP